MPVAHQVSMRCCVAAPEIGCPMQIPIGIANRMITFLEYRQLQDYFIGYTCHVERTKKDYGIQEPTLRQLEEHFILYEMELFEAHFLHYLPKQAIDYAAYLMGEIEDIKSGTNRYFTWVRLGREPTEEELAMHYITSQAHENYRARFWHLVKD
jgi:hypothetical protein